MIIYNKIVLDNFLSFYECNIIKFSKKSNILIGRNEAGKSKIFDAFLLLFQDKIYTKERGLIEFDHSGFVDPENGVKALPILNWKAKREHEDGDIEASLELYFTYTNPLNDDETNYILSKRIKFNKNIRGQWKFISVKKQLEFIEPDTGNTQCLTQNDELKIHIRSLFRDRLFPYLFYQGERRDEVLNIKTKTKFDQALKDLSNLEMFDLAERRTVTARSTIRKALDKKMNLSKQAERDQKDLIDSIKTLEKEQLSYEEKIKEKNNELKLSKSQNEKIEKKLSEVEEYAKCLDKIKGKENEKKSAQKSLDFVKDSIVEKVLDRWVLIDTTHFFQKFDEYIENEVEEHKFPPDIPIKLLREMLDSEKCEICGSDAQKNSPQYKSIYKWFEKASDAYGEQERELSKMRGYSEDRIKDIQKIDDEKRDYYEQIKDTKADIQKYKEELEYFTDQLKEIKPEGKTQQELESINYSELLSTRNDVNDDIKEIENDIILTKGRLLRSKDALIDLNKRSDKIIKESGDQGLVAQYQLIQKVEEATKQLSSKFREVTLSSISEAANKSYETMLEDALGIIGRLEINHNDGCIDILNSDGTKNLNPNTANTVVRDLAFMCGILEVANNHLKTSYPFIADAPTSDLDGTNLLNVIDGICKSFGQTIIMIKPEGFEDNSVESFGDRLKLLDSVDRVFHIDKRKQQSDTLQFTKVEEI